jgi:uncharacterized membrane protein
MEPLAILFALGLLALAAVGLVLGIAAYVRVRSLERSVRHLSARMLELRSETRRASDSARAAEAEARAVDEAARESAAPRAPEVATPSSATPSTATPASMTQASVTPVSTMAATPARVESATPPSPLPTSGWASAPPGSVPSAAVPPSAASELRSGPTIEPSAPSKLLEHASHGPGLDVERWLGVRGAAVVGGIVIAIAGFLLLQYTIEHQMITPQARVLLGASIGIACFLAAIPLRRRGYDIVASSITGAGAVLLYAASWAAHVLYGMIGFPAAFAAMVGVTAACGWLAQRHASQVIAVLGLVGGFATPLALSSTADRPVSLFGYLLLLDFGFLFVARKRRWPSIGLLALLGTFVIQALWIGAHANNSC